MDNKAREQYLASQPVTPRAERIQAEPLPELTSVEITVIIVFAVLVGYALYRLFRPPK
jgi:Na+/H+-dicarboxylate symporter